MVDLKKYDNICYQIIGCAMKVHTVLGNGFPEVIYQRALEIELKKSGLLYDREKEQPIFYDGILLGHRRVDFLVDGEILVELKAVAVTDNLNMNQIINYLEAFNLPVGLLINFGQNKLDFKRFVNAKH